MASLILATPTDLDSTLLFYGGITYSDGNVFTVKDGPIEWDVWGSFSYDWSGNIHGTVTEAFAFAWGAAQWKLTGLSVDAGWVQGRIEAGDGWGLLGGLMAGDDDVKGSGGADTLRGFQGDDYIDGGGGADWMAGGAGDDIYVVTESGDQVAELAGEGTDWIDAWISLTLPEAVENLWLKGTVAEGTGNGLANRIEGNAQANRLAGLGGNDTLAGSEGNDTLSGGDGADDLHGGAGNDRLEGGSGSDWMVGGSGNDLYLVDAADDLLQEESGGGSDSVESAVSWVLGANLERLRLTGSALEGRGNASNNRLDGNGLANKLSGQGGRDTVLGGAGNDSLLGDGGDDLLTGGGGNDLLTGGLGRDLLTGGSGRDLFRVQRVEHSTPGTGRDEVTDFVRGEDRIDLRAIDARLGAGSSNDTFTFIGNAAFSAAGQVRWEAASGGGVLLQAETTGDGIADLEMLLRGPTALGASDILL